MVKYFIHSAIAEKSLKITRFHQTCYY